VHSNGNCANITRNAIPLLTALNALKKTNFSIHIIIIGLSDGEVRKQGCKEDDLNSTTVEAQTINCHTVLTVARQDHCSRNKIYSTPRIFKTRSNYWATEPQICKNNRASFGHKFQKVLTPSPQGSTVTNDMTVLLPRMLLVTSHTGINKAIGIQQNVPHSLHKIGQWVPPAAPLTLKLLCDALELGNI